MAIENKRDSIIEMLDEIKTIVKSQKQPQIDLSRFNEIADKMQTAMESQAEQLRVINDSHTEPKEGKIEAFVELTEQLTEAIEQARKPLVSERKITIDIVSKWTVFIFIGAFTVIAVLSSTLYLATRPNYDRMDNDLKYRYIKMKGEATPSHISDLETLFEIQRDNAKIRLLRKDVEHYEHAIKAKATLDEQTRLRQQEAEKLQKEAEALKDK